jgi:hypothetical protein
MSISLTDEQHEQASLKVAFSGDVTEGREGWEFWRALGEMRHVYAYRLKNGSKLRLVGPPHNPALFSNRSERMVKV